MRRKQVEVRGCCMGIPFGCSTVLLGVLAALIGIYKPSASFLLTSLAVLVMAAFTAAVVLITVELILENRGQASES